MMTEPFYGTVASSPIWSGTTPGFGFFPTPLGFGVSHGTEGFGPSSLPQTPMTTLGQGFQPTGALPGIGQPNYGFTTQGFGGGMMPSIPGFGGFEFPLGINAPAVVAAVAMRRGQPQGPANDQDIEEFIFDALELLSGTNDVDVRVEGGRVTLTGGVQQKRLKHDVGEIAWAIPSVNDVVNNLNIATRRRTRGSAREGESQQPGAAARKQG